MECQDNILEQILPMIHDTTSFLSNIHIDSEVIIDKKKIVNDLARIPNYLVFQNENTNDEFVEKVKQLSKSRR